MLGFWKIFQKRILAILENLISTHKIVLLSNVFCIIFNENFNVLDKLLFLKKAIRWRAWSGSRIARASRKAQLANSRTVVSSKLKDDFKIEKY